MLADVAACATITWEGEDGFPRMLRSAPRKRRDALLIRGPSAPGSRLLTIALTKMVAVRQFKLSYDQGLSSRS